MSGGSGEYSVKSAVFFRFYVRTGENTLYSELRQTHPVHITQGYTLEEIYDNDPELLANKSLVDLDDEEVEDELMNQVMRGQPRKNVWLRAAEYSPDIRRFR